MGAINSKTSLERRNTILKRSQRSDIYKLRKKIDKIGKDSIRADKDTLYELRNNLITIETKLKNFGTDLHPACKNIYEITRTEIKDLVEQINSKVQNRAKVNSPQPIEENLYANIKENDASSTEYKEEDDLESVDLRKPEDTKVEIHEMSKRQTQVMKLGVPVMPVSILDNMNRQTGVFEVVQEKCAQRIKEITEKLSDIEVRINDFVGRKGGEEYLKIQEELDGYKNELELIHSDENEEIVGQIEGCKRYIQSCLTFLDEKTVNVVSFNNNNNNINNNGVVKDDRMMDPMVKATKTTFI